MIPYYVVTECSPPQKCEQYKLDRETRNDVCKEEATFLIMPMGSNTPGGPPTGFSPTISWVSCAKHLAKAFPQLPGGFAHQMILERESEHKPS